MAAKDIIRELVNEIIEIIPLPDEATSLNEKNRIALQFKIKEWETDFLNYLKDPSFKAKAGFKTQINQVANGENIEQKIGF